MSHGAAFGYTSRFALPQHWTGKPGRDRWLFIAALAGVAIAITISLLALGVIRFSVAPLVVFMFLAISAAVTTHSVAVRPWRNGIGLPACMPILESETATALPYGRTPRFAIYLLMLPVMVVFLFGPIIPEIAPQGPDPRMLRWVPAVARYMPIAAVYPAAILLSPLVRRRKILAMGLAPSGVYHWTWFGCRFIAWDWISSIEAFPHQSARIKIHTKEPRERPHNPEENWVHRLIRRANHQVVVAYLNVHPTLPYYALHYYLRHPEKRDELGTDAALDRMRRLDFPDIIAEIKRHGDVRSP